MARHEYSGAAPATTLQSGINNSTLAISLASGTGYPTGAVGPFVITIDRGLSTEEKVLVDTRSGTSLTVNASGRGYDGTSAQSHSAGAVVEHTLSAAKMDDLDDHVYDPTRDDHTQYAKKASPTFTGTPAAPTAAAATNTTQIATTAFVQAAITALINGAPGALDTLDELAAALGDNASYATTITNALALKAPLASPTFTGTVTLPSGTVLPATLATSLGRIHLVAGEPGRLALTGLRQGDIAHQIFDNRRYFYTGSGWKYLTEGAFGEDYAPVFTPGGNIDAAASASWSNWLAVDLAQDIPDWATQVIVTASVNGVFDITSANHTYYLRVALGSQYGDQTTIQGAGVGLRTGVTWSSRITGLTGGGTTALYIQSWRVGGSNNIRADGFSRAHVALRFLP